MMPKHCFTCVDKEDFSCVKGDKLNSNYDNYTPDYEKLCKLLNIKTLEFIRRTIKEYKGVV